MTVAVEDSARTKDFVGRMAVKVAGRIKDPFVDIIRRLRPQARDACGAGATGDPRRLLRAFIGGFPALPIAALATLSLRSGSSSTFVPALTPDRRSSWPRAPAT